MTGQEAAKIGKACFHSGREQGLRLRPMARPCGEQDRAVIAALKPMRARSGVVLTPLVTRAADDEVVHSAQPETINDIQPEASVIYGPAGGPRACRRGAVEIRGSRAYLAPILRTCVGWISLERL